jgi:hypothetical protein
MVGGGGDGGLRSAEQQRSGSRTGEEIAAASGRVGDGTRISVVNATLCLSLTRGLGPTCQAATAEDSGSW